MRKSVLFFHYDNMVTLLNGDGGDTFAYLVYYNAVVDYVFIK